MKKHLSFKNQDGVEYRIVFLAPKHPRTKEECDGLCDDPESKKPKVHINPNLKEKRELEVVAEELIHAHFYDKNEREVRKLAGNLAKILWKLGWRKH